MTLFESLVTMLLLFVVLSSVVVLLQASLRAMKSQQGREISEITFVQELIRRDVADALSITDGSGALSLRRNDCTVPWQELLVVTSPAAVPPIAVDYRLVDGALRRTVGSAPPERLVSLESFLSQRRESDLRVSATLISGQRTRTLIWNFWCPVL